MQLLFMATSCLALAVSQKTRVQVVESDALQHSKPSFSKQGYWKDYEKTDRSSSKVLQCSKFAYTAYVLHVHLQ